MTEVDRAVAAVRAGELVVVPTDTVYGLACAAESEDAVRRLSESKGRATEQPIALLAASVEALLERVPELRGESERLARALLPGPYTLVLANPARRLLWLAGDRPETIGVRVPDVTGVARELLGRVGAVAATSANLHGGADPGRVEDVPEEIRAAAGAVLDGGELPGIPSTVVDLTGHQPRVLRVGAVPALDVLERLAAGREE